LSLNVSCATALYFAAHIHGFGGKADAAARCAKRALRLSPFDPMLFMAYEALGMASVCEARYEDAASHFAKSVQANPNFSSQHFAHAITLALAGRMAEARGVKARALELEPGFRSCIFIEVGMPQPLAEKLVEGARLLGLPD
jgi:adenylate cyclase